MEVAASNSNIGSSFDDQLELEVSPAGSAVSAAGSEDEGDLRRGPWTMEEDVLLVNYIAKHGEGRWNSLARSAGNNNNYHSLIRIMMIGGLEYTTVIINPFCSLRYHL